MSIENLRNGATPASSGMVTTSSVRDEYTHGRKRFTVYAMHVPIADPQDIDLKLGVSQPRMAGAPIVIGQATLVVPNLDVARMLHAAIGEMLAKQPPEI